MFSSAFLPRQKEKKMLNKKTLLFIISLLVGVLLCGCETTSSMSDTSENNVSDSTNSEELSEEESDFEGSSENSEEVSDVIGNFMEETNVELETYTNALMDGYTENAWQGYGFGDPFVMRYNGKYYLYSSTQDWYTGIKVWVSDDLINWKYGGYCTTESATRGAYAPEVTYYNGNFYMYTSPEGRGHYVLKASNPFGPFKVVTNNQGNSIDGHVFIDDNGMWYFYHAADKELSVKEMNSPTDISAPDLSAGVSCADGWTEGPMVIKNNGVYYLTYCGNHVWSKGYRIEGAVGTSPLSFNDIAQNILLLNTDYPYYGFGHSSTVVGPDMDTYYIVYHSFSRVGRRRMHIDALCLNGKDFSTFGPTYTAQQKPKMPDIYTDSSDFSGAFSYNNAKASGGAIILSENGSMLTNEVITADKYTAEINFYKLEDNSGMLFSYVDENNYGFASLNGKSQSLTVTIYKNGEKSFEQSVQLPKSFNTNYDFNKLQTLSLKKDGNEYTFLFNGLALETYNLEIPNGKFGAKAISYAKVGYTAISFASNGSSLKTYYKPIEGKIPAITAVEDGRTVNRYGIYYVVMNEGFIRNYLVNVEKSGTYDVGIMYYASSDTVLEVYKGGELLGTVILPSNQGKISTATLRNISLNKGFGVISFKVVSGSANVLSYTFTKSSSVSTEEVPMDSCYYRDGTWEMSNDKFILKAFNSETISNGKILFGNEGMGDYAVEADFTFDSHNKSVGLIIRGKNPALGGAGDDSLAGKYFFQGYHVCFDNQKGVLIYKVNYERGAETISFDAQIQNNVKYTLRVEAIGNTLKVYLNGELLGVWEDNYLPFLNGAFGFTGLNSTATVENLKIEAIDNFSK